MRRHPIDAASDFQRRTLAIRTISEIMRDAAEKWEEHPDRLTSADDPDAWYTHQVPGEAYASLPKEFSALSGVQALMLALLLEVVEAAEDLMLSVQSADERGLFKDPTPGAELSADADRS